MSRKCVYCDGPIPEDKPVQTRYCSIDCCDREHRLRAKQALFDDGWNAAIEAAAGRLREGAGEGTPTYLASTIAEYQSMAADEILELKPPKVKINVRT